MRRSRYLVHKMGLNSKVHFDINAKGRVIKIIFTDCKVTFVLIKNIKVDVLIADRTYDTNDTIGYIRNSGIELLFH